MYLYIPLFLLLTISPFADAHLPNPVLRAANQIHRRAIKRSSGLARDIRMAFGGMMLDKRSSGQTGNVYCVSNPNVNGTSPTTGDGTVSLSSSSAQSLPSSSGRASATASGGSSAPTGSATSSAWKLKQNYVSPTLPPSPSHSLTLRVMDSKATLSSMAGTSSRARIPQTDKSPMSIRIPQYV